MLPTWKQKPQRQQQKIKHIKTNTAIKTAATTTKATQYEQIYTLVLNKMEKNVKKKTSNFSSIR